MDLQPLDPPHSPDPGPFHSGPVFTDPSGQRGRLMKVLGAAASILLVGALVLTGLSLFGGPGTPFSMFGPGHHGHAGGGRGGQHGHGAPGRHAPGSGGSPGRRSQSASTSPSPSRSGSRSPSPSASPTSSASGSPAPTNSAGKTPPGRTKSPHPHPSPSSTHGK